MEKETKRILLSILETMKEQQGRYPVDGLADRIERIAHQVRDLEYFTIEHHQPHENL
jgi:hypothetical protein